MPRTSLRLHAALIVLLSMAAPSTFGLEVILPQGRAVFQTNETIDVSVVRFSDQNLAAGDLTLTLADDAGSRLEFVFPVAAGEKRKTEHLHLNGWLLRPGNYNVEAAVDGQKATSSLEIASHIRQSSFRLVNWGQAKTREQQLVQGEDSLGFNLFYGHYGRDDEGHLMRAGVDFMANCVMSGGHQMDLRMECDWSDPYVTKGGTRRVVRRAMIDRTRPNVPGVHFYDEPGLTWHKHPVTGEFTPHGIPAQIRSYKAAYDRDPLQYNEVDPANPEHVARWQHWARWKLGLMDAAWRESQYGVSRVRPDFLSLTQSQYGWSAFTDGYYFNVVRSLPITSGHGGYHDFGPGYFNPSYFLEMSRARDGWKPCWYLPTWYGSTTADQFRLEQYLSFQTGIQGMISPPDCEPVINAGPRQGIVESNQLMKRLGTIFTTMPPTKGPVALLYSLSQNLHTQTKDRGANYAHANAHGQKLPLAYLAGKLIQQQVTTVVDEDILDGTLAADHKAILLTGIDYLDPTIVKSLEAFAKGGGLVLLTGDCTVNLAGATKLDVTPRMPDQEKIDELNKAGKWQEAQPLNTVSKHLEGATPLASALKAALAKAGIKPVFECDVPTIIASRHAAGDIEYLFAVNATPDPEAKNEKGERINNAIKAVEATITFPNDGRYTLEIMKTPEDFIDEKPHKFRFGPGQMRVFVRSKEMTGHAYVSTPVLRRELVRERAPNTVTIAGSMTLITHLNTIANGSIPLRIRVVDPLGNTRYDLYRATHSGHFSIELPLAANDPAGDWEVVVTNLLNDELGNALHDEHQRIKFRYELLKTANAMAGATWRAVHLADDRDNAFRFARTFDSVTIVKGSSDFNNAAAERLTKILAPWGIKCNVLPLDQAARSRSLTEEEAKTWVGLDYTGTGNIKPGDVNPPQLVGFNVRGPVILLGNPDDNPLIAFLQKYQFFPYTPHKEKFPGPGRGYYTWQRDAVGAGQESITLIAYDATGMSEVVGSFYEAAAGIDPLTRWSLPTSSTIAAASTQKPTPSIATTQIGALPDRIVGLKLQGADLTALSHDGTLIAGPASDGFAQATSSIAADVAATLKQFERPDNAAALAAAQKHQPRFLAKFSETLGDRSAIAYWGGRLELRDKEGRLLAASQLPHDISAMISDGTTLVVGLADGRVLVTK